MLASNTNDDALGSDDVEAHRLATNDNEIDVEDLPEPGNPDGDRQADEEVEAQMLASNDNETVTRDRRRLAANTNEEALADDEVDGD